jgi:hypothetical protein
MGSFRLVNVAGTMTVVMFGAAYCLKPQAMAQQASQPLSQPGRSQAPRPVVPGQPSQVPSPTPGQTTTQPGQPGATGPALPAAPGTAQPANRRFFAFASPEMEPQFNQAATQLARTESQLTESNQRLLKQLGQARSLQGDRRSEAFAEVMQGTLQQNAMLLQQMQELRTLLTGQLTDPNAPAGTTPGASTPARTTNPGTTPANNPSNLPR